MPTPLQGRPTWLGPPSTSPPEVRDMPRSDHSFYGVKESSRDFDANHRRNPMERVIIRGVEDYLGRSEEILVEGEEFETYLLAPSDVAGIITVLAKNVCDGGADRKFAFIKKGEGNVVAAAGRNVALPENQERYYKEVQEAMEYMNAEQSRL